MSSSDMQHPQALYLDLEWTCWNFPPPPGMKPEIIEIGIAEMDLSTLIITQEAGYFVRPRRWEISAQCTKLTGITDGDIRKAKPLEEVLAVLTRKFQPANKACCTWGDDVAVMARACRSMGLNSPFRYAIDLSKVFQGVFAAREHASLGSAIQVLGMEFDGLPHGALPDARNTARLHAAILRRMRREPDPAPTLISEREEFVSLSPFAEKLAESLK
jgi:inhibitor of KinA sporulation pathway (predicted exonuclease)